MHQSQQTEAAPLKERLVKQAIEGISLRHEWTGSVRFRMPTRREGEYVRAPMPMPYMSDQHENLEVNDHP